MAKHFSFVAENVTPVSQNNRSLPIIARLQDELAHWHNVKYPLAHNRLPRHAKILSSPLTAKVFYIHKVNDRKDADNISKPLWDSLNAFAYKDDEQIKYLETLKIPLTTTDIHEMDVTEMDDIDFEKLISFLRDPQKERFLYVEVSDLECKNVRFT